jgi:hypothetical protein
VAVSSSIEYVQAYIQPAILDGWTHAG